MTLRFLTPAACGDLMRMMMMIMTMMIIMMMMKNDDNIGSGSHLSVSELDPTIFGNYKTTSSISWRGSVVDRYVITVKAVRAAWFV
jgi:hypothetical protein